MLRNGRIKTCRLHRIELHMAQTKSFGGKALAVTNAVLDLEKPSALTEEECELLIQYLLAENNVVLEEYRICYMRGLMDGMEIKKTVE